MKQDASSSYGTVRKWVRIVGLHVLTGSIAISRRPQPCLGCRPQGAPISVLRGQDPPGHEPQGQRCRRGSPCRGVAATAGDASNGYIAPATLAGCVSQAKAKGWSYVPLLFLSSFSHADRKQGRGHDLGVPRRCGFVDLDGTGTVLARLSTTASTTYTRALFLIATIGLRERDCRFRTVFDIGICILSVLRS